MTTEPTEAEVLAQLEQENGQRVATLVGVGVPWSDLQTLTQAVRIELLVDRFFDPLHGTSRVAFETAYEAGVAEMLDDLWEQQVRPQIEAAKAAESRLVAPSPGGETLVVP